MRLDALEPRLRARVDEQFGRRIAKPKCAVCWRAACRQTARPFGGLVYRQVLEYLHGVRDEASDARAHRAGEPPLRAAAVDLVPQRA